MKNKKTPWFTFFFLGFVMVDTLLFNIGFLTLYMHTCKYEHRQQWPVFFVCFVSHSSTHYCTPKHTDTHTHTRTHPLFKRWKRSSTDPCSYSNYNAFYDYWPHNINDGFRNRNSQWYYGRHRLRNHRKPREQHSIDKQGYTSWSTTRNRSALYIHDFRRRVRWGDLKFHSAWWQPNHDDPQDA